MAYHGPSYGLDAELEAKRKASYDPKLEQEARQYIESHTGEKVGSSFHEALKDGVLLCKMINKIKPNSVPKIGTGKMPFVMMENISAYLKACQNLSLPNHDLFQTVDLYEAKNMNQVVANILAVKRTQGGKMGSSSVSSSSSASSSSASSPASSGPQSGFRFCSQCGTKNPANAKFCSNCGASMH